MKCRDYMKEHELLRKEFWMANYTASVRLGDENPCMMANLALRAFDERFPAPEEKPPTPIQPCD